MEVGKAAHRQIGIAHLCCSSKPDRVSCLDVRSRTSRHSVCMVDVRGKRLAIRFSSLLFLVRCVLHAPRLRPSGKKKPRKDSHPVHSSNRISTTLIMVRIPSHLSRSTDYALRSLLELSKTDKPLSSKELARRIDAPKRFLPHLLAKMVKSRILKSNRGVDGGHWLARPLEEVTLLEVMEAIDGPLGCSMEGEPENDWFHSLRCHLESISQSNRALLANVRISELRPISDSTPKPHIIGKPLASRIDSESVSN